MSSASWSWSKGGVIPVGLPQESGSGLAELRPGSATAKTRFLAERPENLAAADEQWPILLAENTQKLRTQNSRKAKEKLKNFSSETRIIR